MSPAEELDDCGCMGCAGSVFVVAIVFGVLLAVLR